MELPRILKNWKKSEQKAALSLTRPLVTLAVSLLFWDGEDGLSTSMWVLIPQIKGCCCSVGERLRPRFGIPRRNPNF